MFLTVPGNYPGLLALGESSIVTSDAFFRLGGAHRRSQRGSVAKWNTGVKWNCEAEWKERIPDALGNATWNSEEEALRNNRKRRSQHLRERPIKKRRKTNRDEKVDGDSYEAHYKQKVNESNSDSDVEVSKEKKGVFEFVPNTPLMELLMSHCSQKSATAVINAAIRWLARSANFGRTSTSAPSY